MNSKHILYRNKISKFDRSLLPPGTGKPGTSSFKLAVLMYLAAAYLADGEPATVLVDDHEILVLGIPQTKNPVDFGIDLLQRGEVVEGISFLERLSHHFPNDFDLYYNLGVAHNHLGQCDEAIIRLKKAIKLVTSTAELSPSASRAYSALAFAYSKRGKLAEALAASRSAVANNPSDEYALLNLGTTLMHEGELVEAESLLRKALAIQPGHPRIKAVLGLVLSQSVDSHVWNEATTLLTEAIPHLGDSDSLEEDARKACNSIAQKRILSRAVGGFRMDVLEYLTGAMMRFEKLGREKTALLLLEVSQITSNGVNITGDGTYRVDALGTKVTGIHLLSILYAGLRYLGKEMDIGVDFSTEYEMAKMHRQAR